MVSKLDCILQLPILLCFRFLEVSKLDCMLQLPILLCFSASWLKKHLLCRANNLLCAPCLFGKEFKNIVQGNDSLLRSKERLAYSFKGTTRLFVQRNDSFWKRHFIFTHPCFVAISLQVTWTAATHLFLMLAHNGC